MLPDVSPQSLAGQPLLALPVLFLAGLATSFTPCIYPMIPITAGILGSAGAGQRSRGRTVALSLLYALGLALVYALLGLLAGLSGTFFGTVSTNRWALLLMGNLLLVFALAMFDVFTIRVPSGLLGRVTGLRADAPLSVFLMGASSGLVAAPCGAPAFAAVLTWVGSTRSGVLGFVYLFVFSLGMSALLVLTGVLSGTAAALPRAGQWMVWVKRAGGVLLLAMAQYYFVEAGKSW